MKKILLTTDLAAKSDRAMARALIVAKEQGASLNILHVIPYYKGKSGDRERQAKELIKSMLDKFDGYNHLKIEIDVVDSKEIHQTILEYAHEMKADLIVMGLHGKTKFRDLFTGTVIERVIRKGNKPVLMVKEAALDTYQTVIAGIDFAPASRNALRLAYDLCPRASFEVLHTYFLPNVYASGSSMGVVYVEGIQEATVKAHQDTMTAFINTEENFYKKTHGQKEIKIPYEISEHDPYRAMVKKVKDRSADLITIGAHSKSIVTPSKLGGVAEDILANPPCDVLVLSE